MRIAIIQGHPDASETHLGHALARAYADAAEKTGHEVRNIIVAQLAVPLLYTKDEWQNGEVPETVMAAQDVMMWADHLLIVHPLWLGSMPASFKAFLEQVSRPDFTVVRGSKGALKRLSGRSARVVLTMGMSGLLYRFYFMAQGLKSLVRNILKFAGISPVSTTVVGMVEGRHNRVESKWLPLMRRYGALAI
ncbi:NAD(P)H-dependent oxidoreductase [Hydrocarboniphaga sp.]|uniref:NAD(P)H-dependent oxidoreductase n=1 Tax=Hydrocarboniphaga sp. TaxID=2033016 RepID=UPI003D1013B9